MKQLSLLLIFFVATLITRAQFSSDAKTPLAISNAANSQHNVIAVDDAITSTGGYFVFWLDNRSNASNAELYGQRLDPDGNIQWESQGRFIAGSGSTITGLAVTKWQQGLLLTYVIHSDSVMCMYLDSNGHNMWANPSVVARKQGSVIYLDAASCLGVFPTTTGATITYYITLIGGVGAIGYNKVDFNGNVLLGNTSKTYTLSGYDYRVTSDDSDGLYILSKGNGIGSTMVIDRLDSSGNKLWGSGIDITSGISTNGFDGNISMCVDSKRNLYVTWDAPSGNILHTKILNSGSFGWASPRIPLSTSSPLNAFRCNAKINSNDSVNIMWLESVNGTTSAMLQKVAPDGGLSLPSGGLTVGAANSYYGYPQISFDGNKTVCVFTVPTKSTIGLGAQSINPDNTLNWSSTKVLGDLYLAWNFYQDYVSLDAIGGCNAVFWTGIDGNIYGGSTCKIVDILPIRTGSLKIETINGGNKILWQGYNQQKGDSYSIERSSDGVHFIGIGKIAAIGLNYNYSFIDEAPLNGINYYRIKIINEAGLMGYSNIVTAINGNTKTRINVYPNPVKNILNIILENTTATGKIIISDMSGKILKTLDALNGTISVDLSGFASGIYFVKYNDDSHNIIIKVQKY